jgi:hypothetical protein
MTKMTKADDIRTQVTDDLTFDPDVDASGISYIEIRDETDPPRPR